MQNIAGIPGGLNHRLTLPGSDRNDAGVISLNAGEAIAGEAISGNAIRGGQQVEFSKVLESALDHVSGLQDVSTEMQTNIELGFSDDLVGTMIASQKASLAFQGVVQARNRVVSAYETVFNMPV